MSQLLIALTLAGTGIFLMWQAFVGYSRSELKVIVGGLVGCAGILWIAGLLISLCNTQIGVDADLAKYEQVKIAVKAAKAGDPSYSGILMEAVHWNQSIAISRGRVDSAWWGLYYSRKIAALELIEMPGAQR